MTAHYYPYGAFYDVNIPGGMENSDAIVIYSDLINVTGELRSLEGIFVSQALIKTQNPLCLRKQMEEFEKLYKGEFIEFTQP